MRVGSRVLLSLRGAWIAVAAIGLVLAVAAAVPGQPRPPFRVVVAQDTDAKSWDPPQDWTTAHQWIIHNVYDPVLFRNPEGSAFDPKLAERWEQVNDLTMRFHLRRGVKFHDGSEFTAEDVRYHYLRIRDGTEQQYIVQPEWQFFSEAIVRDRYTVDLVTPRPDALLLHRGISKTSGAIVSKAYVERVKPEGVHRQPMGAGPYRLRQWVRGEQVVFDANPDYWGGRPDVDELVFRAIPEASTRTAELLTGGVDITYGLVQEDEARLRQRANIRPVWAPSSRGWMLYPRLKVNERYKGNAEDDRKLATEDPRVRRAIELAIDKYALRNLVQKQGEVFRARLFRPLPEANPALWGRSANLYNQQQARQILREAGYAPGQPRLVFHASDAFPSGDIARATAAMLRRVGFTVDLRLLDNNTFNTAIYFPRRTQELILLNLGGNDNPFFGTFEFHSTSSHGRTPSGYGYGRADLDRLIDCAWQDVRDDQRRLRCFHRASEIIADERYVIGLFQIYNLWGINSRVQYRPRLDNYIEGIEMKRTP